MIVIYIYDIDMYIYIYVINYVIILNQRSSQGVFV